MTQKNGNLVKWIAVFITIGTVFIIWIWNASAINSSLQSNIKEDEKVHSHLQIGVEQNRENIITNQKTILQMQTKYDSDMAYIKKGIDELRNKP